MKRFLWMADGSRIWRWRWLIYAAAGVTGWFLADLFRYLLMWLFG